MSNESIEISNDNLNCWENEFALLTSGTTSMPKIVVYDGKAICSQILTSYEVLKKNPTIKHDRKVRIKLMAFLPFYHIFGLVTTLLWFTFFGRTLIFLPNMEARTIETTCKRHNPTHFFAVPLVFETVADTIIKESKKIKKDKLLFKAVKFSNTLQSVFPFFGAWFARNILFKNVRRKALGSSLTFCISGGSSISKQTKEIMNGLGYSLYNGYGLTEAGIVSVELSLFANKRLSDSVGNEFSCIKYNLDENSNLLLSSPTMCKKIIQGGIEEDSKKWITTNDIFKIKDKKLYMITRSDDVIIGSGGENISPESIEEYFKTDGTKFCALSLKIDEKDLNEIILAVQFDGNNYKKAACIADIYKIIDIMPIKYKPAKVIETDIPITALGKPQWCILKKKLENGGKYNIISRISDKDMDRIYDESFKKVIQNIKLCFAQVLNLNEKEISDFSDFIFDLGGSSIQYYELISVISEKMKKEFILSGEEKLLTPADFTKKIIDT
jgi:acyl-CoA synthetase (AMP-forming)/AMP-acid ligase II/acyl carrier protein